MELLYLRVTQAEAAVLESSLFRRIQLLEENKCNISDWLGVDLWDLFCRVGQLAIIEDSYAPSRDQPRKN